MDLKRYLQKGAKIVAINSNEELHGTVLNYDEVENVLEMDDVFDKKTNYQYDSVIFINIRSYNLKLQQFTTLNSSINNQNEDESSDENSRNLQKRDSTSCSELSLSKENCFRIEAMISTAVKIQSYDSENFANAIHFLEMENEISLVFQEKKAKSSKNLRFLCLATWSKIFIFDFLALKVWDERLKNLLESECIKKIVYSMANVDYFSKSLNIELKGVLVLTDLFDKSKICRDSGNVNLNLRNFIGKYWKPLRKSRDFNEIQSLAELAILQLRLFDMNLHGFVLKEFYSRHLEYAKVLTNFTDCEASCLVLSNQQLGKEAINPTDESWKLSSKHLQ